MSDFVLAENSRYLSQSQIDHVKDELNSLGKDFEGFQDVLSLIDRYVRTNETADEAYDTFFGIVTKINEALPVSAELEDTIRATVPMLSGIAFYDYLILTGILTAGDLQTIASGPMSKFNPGGIPQA